MSLWRLKTLQTGSYAVTNQMTPSVSPLILVSISAMSRLVQSAGYYSQAWRQKFIHINNDLPADIVPFVCAHELGHALLHPNASTPFLRANTLLSVNRLEIEANRFAACLLLSDADIVEYAHSGYTTAQVSACTGLPETLVQYRADTCPALNGV